MSTPQHCLAKAEEAERLAGIVSYERDKVRLRAQAAAWREKAGEFDAGQARTEAAAYAPAFGWKLTRLFALRHA